MNKEEPDEPHPDTNHSVGSVYGGGAFREILVVRYYGAVSGRRAWSASGLAGAIEGYDLLILAAIFRSGFHPVLMLAYTIGVAAGTFFGTRTNK